MLNAIRISIGLIMAVIAVGGTFVTLVFIRFQFWLYFTSTTGFQSILFVSVVPSIAAYLLLFPKTQKHAYFGLSIAILYLGYVFVDQII